MLPKGSTRMGRLPPTLLITNMKTPTTLDRTSKGTISTITANTIPNLKKIKLQEAKLTFRLLFLFKKKLRTTFQQRNKTTRVKS